MSSLHKFHRRTMSTVAALAIGSGTDIKGYWLGTAGDGTSKLIVAPKSTEVSRVWGSYGTTRGTTSTTNGIANTTTLFNLGSAAHPAAYHARSLTTGGYSNWYLPAISELITCWSNHLATPFATSNAFIGDKYWSSTEINGNSAWVQYFNTGVQNSYTKIGADSVRAARRYNPLAATTVLGDGSDISGYWIGTAGDGTSKLIVAPKSTETHCTWGSYGTTRGTTSLTDGIANTTTLFNLGSAAHPAAYYCRALTTGGYSNWYLPAKNELNAMYSNKAVATSSDFIGSFYWSSTENNGNRAWSQYFSSGIQDSGGKQFANYVRAARRSTI